MEMVTRWERASLVITSPSCALAAGRVARLTSLANVALDEAEDLKYSWVLTSTYESTKSPRSTSSATAVT